MLLRIQRETGPRTEGGLQKRVCSPLPSRWHYTEYPETPSAPASETIRSGGAVMLCSYGRSLTSRSSSGAQTRRRPE